MKLLASVLWLAAALVPTLAQQQQAYEDQIGAEDHAALRSVQAQLPEGLSYRTLATLMGQGQGYIFQTDHGEDRTTSDADETSKGEGEDTTKDYVKEYVKDYVKDYAKDYAKEYSKDRVKEHAKEYAKRVVIHKAVPVPYPVAFSYPTPATQEKQSSYPVKVQHYQPYEVTIYKPYPVPLERQLPYNVEKPVPSYTVKVPTDRQQATYTVEKTVPYTVEKPIPSYTVKMSADGRQPIYTVEKTAPSSYTVKVPADRQAAYTVEKTVPYTVKVPVKLTVQQPLPYEVSKSYAVHLPVGAPKPYKVELPSLPAYLQNLQTKERGERKGELRAEQSEDHAVHAQAHSHAVADPEEERFTKLQAELMAGGNKRGSFSYSYRH